MIDLPEVDCLIPLSGFHLSQLYLCSIGITGACLPVEIFHWVKLTNSYLAMDDIDTFLGNAYLSVQDEIKIRQRVNLCIRHWDSLIHLSLGS